MPKSLTALLVSIAAALSVGGICASGLRGSSPPIPHAKESEPPFDKLELFGFFAAGPVHSYSAYIIRQRGTDFTPDKDFIAYFPLPARQKMLRDIVPRIAHKPSPERDQAYRLACKAYGAQSNRDFAAANPSYLEALKLVPNSPTLHLAYAANLLLPLNYSSADEQIRESIKLWPGNAEAHAMLALSMMFQGRHAESELESKEALRIFPGHEPAKFTLAHALIHQQKYKEAIPVVREGMAEMPSMTMLRKFLGIALVETGDNPAGLEQLLLYGKLAPDDAEGHYCLGVALRKAGRLGEAHDEFSQATRLDPTNPQFEAAAHGN